MKKTLVPGAKCKFCVADNEGEYKHIYLFETDDWQFFCKCTNCSAETKTYKFENLAVDAWEDGEYTIPVQSEEQILNGCVSLMDELVCEFVEWLKWMDIEVKGEEIFRYSMNYFHIVNRLFLWHTNHSGGTSTMAKCRELGVDSSSFVVFGIEEDDDAVTE